jgi:hypothetical protein
VGSVTISLKDRQLAISSVLGQMGSRTLALGHVGRGVLPGADLVPNIEARQPRDRGHTDPQPPYRLGQAASGQVRHEEPGWHCDELGVAYPEDRLSIQPLERWEGPALDPACPGPCLIHRPHLCPEEAGELLLGRTARSPTRRWPETTLVAGGSSS